MQECSSVCVCVCVLIEPLQSVESLTNRRIGAVEGLSHLSSASIRANGHDRADPRVEAGNRSSFRWLKMPRPGYICVDEYSFLFHFL